MVKWEVCLLSFFIVLTKSVHGANMILLAYANKREAKNNAKMQTETNMPGAGLHGISE